MSQKPDRPATPSHRCRRSARPLATQCRKAIWRGSLHRSMLGATGERTPPRSDRLGRSVVGSTQPQTHGQKTRTGSAASAALAEGTKHTWRIWRPGDSTRNGSPRNPGLPLDSHDQPDSSTTGRLGRTPPRAKTTAGKRLVSGRRGRTQIRIGQLRHHRRSGDSWRLGRDRFDGSFAAWRTDRGMDGSGCQCQDRGRVSGGTLASRGTSRLCSVRQRQSFSRTATTRRRGGASDTIVPEPWSCSRVCPAQRNGFSSGHRKFQRTLASEGLVAVRASFASWSGRPFHEVHSCVPTTTCGSHRVGTGSTPLPEALASRSAKASRGNDNLLAADRQPRASQHAGPHIQRRSELAPSFGSRCCQPGLQHHSVLRPATARSNESAFAEGSSIHTSSEAISGVTNRL